MGAWLVCAALLPCAQFAIADESAFELTVWMLSPARFDNSNERGLFINGVPTRVPDGRYFAVAAEGGPHRTGTILAFRPNEVNVNPELIHVFGEGRPTELPGGVANDDGADPIGTLLLASDGKLYGTTREGGPHGDGTLFRVSVSGEFEVLHAFEGQDGSRAQGELVEGPDGNLYGTTRFGGTHSSGTLFRWSRTGGFTSLHSFAPIDAESRNALGAAPRAGLVLARDGHLYGVAASGGPRGGGTVFRLTLDGGISLVHAFEGPQWSLGNLGLTPENQLVVGRDGRLYGTTSFGGAQSSGTVFQLSTAGEFRHLHTFNEVVTPAVRPITGKEPVGPLLEVEDGVFFGVTRTGGPAGGVMYSITSEGDFRLLHAFGGETRFGIDPAGGLFVGDDGYLYGVTGSTALSDGNSFRGAGTLYRIERAAERSVFLSASPDRIVKGESVTLTWRSPENSSCFLFDAIDRESLPSNTGSRSFAPYTSTPFNYFLKCYVPVHGVQFAHALANFAPGPPELMLRAVPAKIALGDPVYIEWSAADADECAASGEWSGPLEFSGRQNPAPTRTGDYSYSMTCRGPGGETTVSTTLTVGPSVPPEVSLLLSLADVPVNGVVPVLSWVATRATACTAGGSWSGARPVTGSMELPNDRAGVYTYSLSCQGIGGSSEASVTLRVRSADSGSGGQGGGGGGALGGGSILWLSALLLMRVASRRRHFREDQGKSH